MQYDPFFLTGIAGMLLILIAFFKVQSHRWSQDSMIYDVFNFLGSVLLVIYGIAGEAWPFVILNGIWAIYSLKDVIVDLGARKR
jgi:hypothetical protein